MKVLKIVLLPLLLIAFYQPVVAQKKTTNPVYIDKKGILRWTKDNSEAVFFGVNYTVPFAYAYRAHKALGIDPEAAIRQDVYHMARLGFNAFRVHVWDTEISDAAGNLLNNEHLRLFDVLLAELKKRQIRVIITPIAFWGNGYPEPDEKTPGFSALYGKGRATLNDSAIKAQENYLQQFFKHINPYTKLSYRDDPDVIATEINNEPSHGAKPTVTSYINRMAAAIKSTGWTKPLFYNISQNPSLADAVAASVVDGYSFQWYPTNLVAGHKLQGNYLPHVDRYAIPFGDTIAAFRNKPRMVYEFDAADIFASYMYPAMAKSFRQAGFQWATQFAYDPLAIAYANTEYQTHYVNLAYTPAKAISLMIAGEAFRELPLQKNYGTYPADSVFDAFRVSYRQQLSEMNNATRFYYSNNTSTQPISIAQLQHIAGVGSSPVVRYTGAGAYFLDKLNDGQWRLEVMPDAVHIRDPFEKASLQKEVTRLQWSSNAMQLSLADLGNSFVIKGLNEGNQYNVLAQDGAFTITPGTYLLSAKPVSDITTLPVKGVIGLTEFVAPAPVGKSVFLSHQPFTEVSAGRSFPVTALVTGVDTTAVLSLLINRAGEGWNRNGNIKMTRQNGFTYTAMVPAELVTPGLLQYRIVVQSNGQYTTWPGNYQGNPFAWDYFYNDQWKTFVAGEKSRLVIFNAGTANDLTSYPYGRAMNTKLLTAEEPDQLIFSITNRNLSADDVTGFQHVFADRLQQRSTELSSFNELIIKARITAPQQAAVKLVLITRDGAAFAAPVVLTEEMTNVVIPLNKLVSDSCLLLPRPYPGFQPLWFSTAGKQEFQLADAEKLQFIIQPGAKPLSPGQQLTLDVQEVWLQKTEGR
ncbi:MAG: cellulase family glycosylhydrolase [Chitinophagaceae bacterium]